MSWREQGVARGRAKGTGVGGGARGSGKGGEGQEGRCEASLITRRREDKRLLLAGRNKIREGRDANQVSAAGTGWENVCL